MTAEEYEAIVIGGGHNGLICSAYLSRAGFDTLLLERREILGGACVTEELFPDCFVSTGACWYGLLQSPIIEDLNLKEHGLEPILLDPQYTALYPDGDHIHFWLDNREAEREIESYPGASSSDARGYRQLQGDLERISEEIKETFQLEPSIWESSSKPIRNQLSNETLQAISQSIEGYLSEYIQSENVRAPMEVPALSLTSKSPHNQGTAYGFFHMNCAEVSGQSGWGIVRGGMGKVTEAIERSARGSGVSIQLDAKVEKVIVKNGEAVGVKLTNGACKKANIVISNANPIQTIRSLVPKDALPNNPLPLISNEQIKGYSSMIHLLLYDLPSFRDKFESDIQEVAYKSTLTIAPSVSYIEKAIGDANNGRISQNPILTLVFPSELDSSVTPPNKHLLSMYAQYTPYKPDPDRDNFLSIVLDALSPYFQNLNSCIEESIVLSPSDLESRFGLFRGHPEHGDMVAGRMLENRGLHQTTPYHSPIPNLYLCGAGTHPGGTVTGAPGYNAAQTVIHYS